MKKNLLLTVGLIVLVLAGCGSNSSDPVTNEQQTPNDVQISQEDSVGDPFEELATIVEQEQAERQEAMEEADNTEMEYVEGTIPPGTYYWENGNFLLFYADEEGGFSLNQEPGRGTYTYDSETGTYTFEYDGASIIVGGHHVIYQGYYVEDDNSIVLNRVKWVSLGDTDFSEGEAVLTRR